MSAKQVARLRRAKQTRIRLQFNCDYRLSVHRTNSHMYAQIFSEGGAKVLASAATTDLELRNEFGNNYGNIAAATIIGKRIAQKALDAGITTVAFDRSGFRYHGRVKALAEAAREAGLKF